MAYSKKTTIGLDSVLIGLIAGDGGMGTALVELGSIVEGTPVINIPVPTTTEIPVEESDDPEFVTTTQGATTIAFSTYNVDPSVLVDLFGGTVTGTAPNEIWAKPAILPIVERSVRMVSRSGYNADMARVKLTPELNLNFQRTTPGQINITGTVLTPTKAGTAPLTLGQPAVG